jgi:peptide/nickel transport system substrate-binding protein
MAASPRIVTAMSELERLTARVRPGAISRREFLGASAGLGVVAAGAAFAAETVKKGGLLRLGMAGGGVTDGLDPIAYANATMIVVGRGLFSGLVELAADGRLAPELATSWEARNSAAEWVLNLRKGVKFSNGQEFTADDAVYSLNLRRGDAPPRGVSPLRMVTEVKKLDPHQIQLTLGDADADFPHVLADHRLPMVPDGFKDWSKPVGAGAFVLEKFEPGVRIALKRAGDYWKEGRGHLDAAEILVLPDWSERLDTLISGQADIVDRVDPRTAGLLAKAAHMEIVRSPGGWHAVMAMEIDKPPYDNPDLRLALKYAIDREQILKALFNGYGALGNDHPIPLSDPYFNKDLPQRKRDPDRAAFHLKRAGLDSSLTLQVSEAAFAGAVEAGVLFQTSAAKAGFKIDVKKEPADGFWDKVWLKGPFVESYWGGRSAATHILWDAYRAGAPLNESHWKNDRFEKLLGDARSETDEARRKSAIWEMQTLLHDEGGALIPVFRDGIDAHRDIVGGHVPHAGTAMDNGYILEKAFLKA